MIYDIFLITFIQKRVEYLVCITLWITGETNKLRMARVHLLKESKVGFCVISTSKLIE